MEIRHLRSFVVLAEERHFGRAAARLHVAQPALSQQLKQLERQVGTRLLDRSTRRVELTAAGRLLLSRAHEVLGTMERTTADLALLAAGRSGTVRMGFVGTATYDVLPRVARRVREELPDVHLELHGERLAPRLQDEVRDGTLDLAVLRPSTPMPGALQPGAPQPGAPQPATTLPDDLVAEHLRDEPLVAVLPAGHLLAAAGEVDLAALAGEPLVTYPAGHLSTMQPRVLEACRRAGFHPTDVLEVGETGTLVVFVAAGLGVALVPASVRALRLDGVAYVPLAGPPEQVPLALVHRPDPAPAVARVAALVSALTLSG